MGSTGASSQSNNPLSLHHSDPYTDDLSGLIKKRYVRVITTFNKTNFFLVGGRRYGFEYSLLKDYEKFLNKNFKKKDLKVVFEFIPLSRDRLIPALKEGYGDIAAAGLTITRERQKEVAFTSPYLTEINEIVVTHKDTPALFTIDDLSERIIHVRKSSSYYESLMELNVKFQLRGILPIRIVTVDENLETEDILELVNAGAIQITISDSHIAEIWANVFEDIRLHEELAVRSGAQIAWMIRKSNPELEDSLNSFLKKHKKGTLHGNMYFNRYYKNTKWIKNPLSNQERIKLERYRKLFKKYAKVYDFDWMLIAALAYQESGFDHDKSSPAGAVGIMQVLPGTSADKNVDITDIEKIENNIHAGVKYLAFLRNRYFSGDNLDDKDRVRFALAAYNAGPTKIRIARSKAIAMGFDPDRWFRNVEMAVLEHVGQETVKYVSNINKYYVLFRSAYQKRMEKETIKEKLLR